MARWRRLPRRQRYDMTRRVRGCSIAAVVRAATRGLDILLAHSRLIRFAASACDSCAHANAAPVELRFAERNLLVRFKILRWNIPSRQLCANQHAADTQG